MSGVFGPLVLELGLGGLMLVVFAGTLLVRGEDRRVLAWITTLGVGALAVARWSATRSCSPSRRARETGSR